MEHLQIQFSINPDLYTKNPETTDLGKKIVEYSIILIDELGFEGFTFKKLGERIGSNESSVYRYFESKHALLIYLVNWYWSWMEYKLVFQTTNITDPKVKLMKAIEVLTDKAETDNAFSYINESILYRIIIAEFSKAYHTKEVDKENEKGYYKTYKRVVQRTSDMVLEVNPSFEFPQMLISTVIEGAHHQRYFSEHLPSLTNTEEGKDTIMCFYQHLVIAAIL